MRSPLRRSLVVVLLALDSACAASSPSLRSGAAASGAAGVPAWLLPADACPADLMRAEPIATRPFLGVCAGDQLDGCLARCRADDGNACYAAAIEVQQQRSTLAEALFLRGCRLGHTSSCTNRAAGMLDRASLHAEANTCAARTFDATCARQDPWGCTMFGMVLLRGAGIATDRDRAREVLPGGCRLGEDDAACKAAHELLAELDGPTTYPEVTGEYAMTEDWKLTVATPMRRRFQDGSLVLWRPGMTAWIETYTKDGETVDQALAGIQADASTKRFDEQKEADGALVRYSYRLAEEGGPAKRPALYGFVVGPAGYVMLGIYFDDEAELPAALALWRSVSLRAPAAP